MTLSTMDIPHEREADFEAALAAHFKVETYDILVGLSAQVEQGKLSWDELTEATVLVRVRNQNRLVPYRVKVSLPKITVLTAEETKSLAAPDSLEKS